MWNGDMMHWFLFALLIILALFIYNYDGYDVGTPSFISVVSFLIASFVFALNATKWDINISFKTIFIIVGALFVFFLGEKICMEKRGVKKYIESNQQTVYYQIPKGIIIGFTIFCFATMIIIIRRALQIGKMYNTSEYLLRSVRTALADENVSWGLLVSIPREAAYAIGYICVFIFFVMTRMRTANL